MKSVNMTELKQSVKNNENLLVMFGATWCGECKMDKPIFLSSEENHSDYDYLLIDVDENKLWEEDNNTDVAIKSVPTFIRYKDGKVANRINSFSTPMQLEEIFKDEEK